jgi:hypothetical protein
MLYSPPDATRSATLLLHCYIATAHLPVSRCSSCHYSSLARSFMIAKTPTTTNYTPLTLLAVLSTTPAHLR